MPRWTPESSVQWSMSVESRIIEDGSPGEESDRDGVIGDGVVSESGEKKVDEERESRQDETDETNPFHARLQEEHFTFSLHLSLTYLHSIKTKFF